MSIKIFNTESKKKEDFVTLVPGQVKMYVCGPTVYDFLHIGNYRGAIFFNSVRNWLEKSGYNVQFVYNYTGVDDKILNRAKSENTEPQMISEKYIAEFQKDYQLLRLRPHTHNPKVTEYIPQIIHYIEDLIKKGHAYQIEGDVYYKVKSFEKYGRLSNKKTDELESGHRIEVDVRKDSPMDFALWKSAKPGEQNWNSPWGSGRPGWHIECSVMSHEILGDSIDIHGGGLDLVFPHHENEIAQSEGCSGKTFVKYWMHNNMLEFGSQKMSKSLGNVRTGRSFLEEYNGEILKFMMLNAHYRSTIDFSEEQVHRTILGLARFYSALSFAEELKELPADIVPLPADFEKATEDVSTSFKEAMDDDFNTAQAISKMFEYVRVFNNLTRKPKFLPEHRAIAEVFLPMIKSLGQIMALFQEIPQEFLKKLDDKLLEKKNLSRAEIEELISKRNKARADKNWPEADKARDELKLKGIAVKDTVKGTTWEVDKSLDNL